MKRAILALALPLLAIPVAAQADLPQDVAAAVAAMGSVNDAGATANVVRYMHALEAPARGVDAVRDIAFGEHPLQRLDVFYSAPEMGAGKPVLIFVHGGGFTGGDKHRPGDFTYDNVMIWAVENGFVGVNTNYRLAPEFTYPSATEDLASAIAWTREHAAEYGGDPNQVFIWGHSAGASLVGTYIGHPEFHVAEGSGLAAAVLGAGSAYEVNETSAYFADASRLEEMDSLAGIVASDVPFFVYRAEYDPPEIFEANGRLNDALCAANKCPDVFLTNASHNHMTQVYTVNTTETDISDRILTFLREYAD